MSAIGKFIPKSGAECRFYVPAAAAAAIAVIAFFVMRDTPQSVGLPPIEEYKNDYPKDYNESHEQEFSAKEIFMKYVLHNKLLWYIAIANAFVYLIRYGVLDWAPTHRGSRPRRSDPR